MKWTWQIRYKDALSFFGVFFDEKHLFEGDVWCACCRAHQTRQSGQNSHLISTEVALPQLQSEIKVALFLFASHSFLANILRFMVKLIDKAIVINGKYIRIRGKCFIQAIKKVNLYWRNSWWKLNPKSKNIQTDDSCTKLIVELCYFLIIFTKFSHL